METTFSTILINRWESAGNKLAALAEAIPADKYDASPIEGVRTAGDVLRHVAFWNRYVADTVRGKQAEEAANELPKSEYATRDKIIGALKRSAAAATEALKEHQASMDSKMTEVVVSFIEHTSEHYGQLAVYARLHGIVPPASR